MKIRLIIVMAWVMALATIPTRGAEIVTVGGAWDQFVVTGPKLGLPLSPIPSSTNATHMLLDPALVAVSCERIKQAITRELAMRDEWRGKIFVVLQPRWRPDAQIQVTSAFSAGRWSYRIETPNELDRERFLRAIVQVLLLEMANRNASARQAEVPFWLSEGLTAHLRVTALAGVLLEPQTQVVTTLVHRDPFVEDRELLRTRPPLTLDELSWPKPGQLEGRAGNFYQSSAHLFVAELLRLKNGPACMSEMLRLLPQYLNWQMAFLRAFGVHFQRLIDVEKWWLLKLVQFTGREPTHTWTRFGSLEQLEAVLSSPAQLRTSKAGLPAAANAPLQTVIQFWPPQRQLPVLREKIQQLQAMRIRVAPEVALLVDAYRVVLESYVQQRSNPGAGTGEKHQPPVSLKVLVRETLKQLGALDVRRAQLRQQKEDNPMVQSAPLN